MNLIQIARNVLSRTEDVDYEVPYLEGEVIEGIYRDEYALPPPGPSLSSVLNSLGHVPSFSALIGLCEDGLPFLMDLSNPSPGSILISGQPGSGKTRLLTSFLTSAARLNDPRTVNFCMITPQLHEAEALKKYPHCLSITAPYERAASEMIIRMSAIAESRRSGREMGPAMILAIDDLAYFAGEYMDHGVYVHLKWLLRNGPHSMIWPVATLTSERLHSLDRGLLSAFSTKFTGGNYGRNIPVRLNPDSQGVSEYLLPESSFESLQQGHRVRFTVPSI
jgi:hypothetical protein